MGLARDVELDVAVGHLPAHDCADSLASLSCHLWPGSPDRRQYAKDVGLGDAVHPYDADFGEDVFLERPPPIGGVPLAFPPRPVRVVHGLSGVFERRSHYPAPFGEGVASVGCG